MKRTSYIFVLLIIISGSLYAGDKIELKWKTFNEGLKEAKASKKKVLIDVYTDWCKWCKKMDQDVYGNELVSKYLSEQYVLVKLNAESPLEATYNDKKLTEREVAGGFGVNSYPTTLFLDEKGGFITPLAGFIPPEKFIDVVKFIGENYYEKMSWDEYQKQNKADTKKENTIKEEPKKEDSKN
jgi:thioredoxin-related protein